MLIIPAIDIRDGKCVRLIQGDYERQICYDVDPVETAQAFADAGARLIHVVDLDGAKLGEPQNSATVERLARQSPIPVEFGGGVRTLDTARRLLSMGVSRVVVGSRLIQDDDLASQFFQEFGDAVVAGIDCRDGMVAIHGWTATSNRTGVELARCVHELGASRIILTDIARDGMLNGPNLELLAQVAGECPLPIISSGGIGSMDHLDQLATAPNPPEGVITGRAIYDGSLNLKEACGRFQ